MERRFKRKILSRAFLRSVNWREARAVMEVAEQGWGFVCVGADFDCDLCCEHEHHLGEGYVDAQSTDFRKSFDSEGDGILNYLLTHIILGFDL